MQLQCLFTGEIITINKTPLAGGGEGRIYQVIEKPGLVAKIYHQATEEDGDKLMVMHSMPPETSMAIPGHPAIAWPVELLHFVKKPEKVIGFLMPRVIRAEPIHIFYTPKNRREQKPLFTYQYLHRSARNLIAAVNALHNSGYVIGDINESNILVTDTALVTLVDTDSFQVYDPYTQHLYRCPVGKPEFTPPELQGINFRDLNRIPEHDLFGLGVLIFQLLMEGTHPFAGVYQGKGDPPPIEVRIKAGHFPYGTKKVPYRAMPTAPSLEILHPEIYQLFLDCFERGYVNSAYRPDTKTWLDVLEKAENSLVTCDINPQHRYGNHLNRCPWCDRQKKLQGRDPFPSKEAIASGEHLRPMKTPRKFLAPITPVPTTPPAPKPPAPIRITQKAGQYPVPILLPTHSPAPLPPVVIPTWGGGHGVNGVITDSVIGLLWGIMGGASLISFVFAATYKGGTPILGAIILGMFWGSFLGVMSDYLMPMITRRFDPLLIGMIGGGFIASALAGIFFGVMNRIAILADALIIGGLCGIVWGIIWSLYKPPLSLPTNRRVRGKTALLLGGMWGADLGLITGLCLGMITIFTGNFSEDFPTRYLINQFLQNITFSVGLSTVSGLVIGTISGPLFGMPILPIPQKLSGFDGAVLGSIWGIFLGAIAGVLLAVTLPYLIPDLFINLNRNIAQLMLSPGLLSVFGAGVGALLGLFSGFVWGIIGKW